MTNTKMRQIRNGLGRRSIAQRNASRCFIKLIIQPLLDAVRLRKVFDYTIALSEIGENAAKRPDSPPPQFVYALWTPHYGACR